MDKVAVIIGDIVESSTYAEADRQVVQTAVQDSWYAARAYYLMAETSQFAFGGGDEFEIVCEDIGRAIDVLSFIRLSCKALDVKPAVLIRASIAFDKRFVVGPSPYESDGPVFHLAREGMTALKTQREWYPKSADGRPAFIARWKKAEAEMLTTFVDQDSERGTQVVFVGEVFSLLDLVYRSWTRLEAEAVLRAITGYSGDEIARELGISPSAVSQRMSKAGWQSYFTALEWLKLILQGELRLMPKQK